jgi:outer membrane protein assembly factor BamB
MIGTEARRARVAAGFWCAYGAAIIGLIVHAYPALLDFRSISKIAGIEPPKRTHLRHPFQTKRSGEPGGATTFLYRGSIQRLGVDDASRVPLELKETWSRRPLNVGIHDANKASPAVDASGIYVGSDTSWFYAFDFEGNVRWKFYFANASHGIHGTAALDEKRVYIGAYNGVLYALDKADGALVWELKLGDAIGSSPGLDGDDLYVSVETAAPKNGFVAKIDKNSGKVIWLTGWLGEQSHSSPAIDPSTGRVYVGANNGRVVFIDGATGEFVSSFKVHGPVKGTAVVAGGSAYFLTRKGWLYAYDLGDGRKERFGVELPKSAGADGREATLGSPAWVPDEGLLIMGFGGFTTAVDAKTGAIQWRYEAETQPSAFGTSSALLVRTAGEARWVAWIGCGKRDLCAFEPRTGEVRARIELPAPLTSVPVAYKSSLYLALNQEGGLMRLDAQTGSRR